MQISFALPMTMEGFYFFLASIQALLFGYKISIQALWLSLEYILQFSIQWLHFSSMKERMC